MMERYEQARDALGLTLATEDGVGIPVSVVHITDYRADLDDEEACELEVHITDAACFADAASPDT